MSLAHGDWGRSIFFLSVNHTCCVPFFMSSTRDCQRPCSRRQHWCRPFCSETECCCKRDAQLSKNAPLIAHEKNFSILFGTSRVNSRTLWEELVQFCGPFSSHTSVFSAFLSIQIVAPISPAESWDLHVQSRDTPKDLFRKGVLAT